MDKTVKSFNVRLRTIKIRELSLGLIIAIILSGVLMIIFPSISESDDLFMTIFLLIMSLFFIILLSNTTGLKSDFNELFNKNNLQEIIYVLILNLLFASLFIFFITIIDILLGFTDPNWIIGFDIDSVDMTPRAFFFNVINSIIFAPIIEELIFRGVIFNRLKIRIGIIPAMILSSILFGIGHDFGGITSAFLFGICMCILFLKTDNILIPMTVHFLNNIIATILETYNIDLLITQIPFIIPFTVLSVTSTILLVKYIIEETSKIKL